jgi:hypothetical protein
MYALFDKTKLTAKNKDTGKICVCKTVVVTFFYQGRRQDETKKKRRWEGKGGRE